MFGAALEGALDDPHPVQLVARKVGIDVVGEQDVFGGDRVAVDLVGVVGDVDLAFSQQLPIEAVRRSEKQFGVVDGSQVI